MSATVTSGTGKTQKSREPRTLSFDIGGSHLKAAVLSEAGDYLSDRVRVVTPKPAKPAAVVAGLIGLAKQLKDFDRVTIGFPGVVHRDAVQTAPNLGTELWHGFKLASVIGQKLGKPVRMLNDASVQGLGAIKGEGLECVITLGTGMGFALFDDGELTPHLELSQHPIRTGKTYDEYIGAAVLKKIGKAKWNKRVHKILPILETVINFDVLYIGGGNAKLLKGPLPKNVKIVSNLAGISGGVRVWDRRMKHAFEPHSPAFVTVSKKSKS